MDVEVVRLYDYYHMETPKGGRAELTCLYQNVPEEMGLNRMRPAVLIIPGGGYRFVSDREAEPVALRWMARGYAAFILRYSVEPLAFPTQLREAALAMRFIRENCIRFEVDPHMVAAVGFSAGGHLCGMLGTMYDCKEIEDVGSPRDICPNALGLCYPVALTWGETHSDTVKIISGGDETLKKRLSLDTLVRPDMPPVYLLHVRDDAIVPCRNSLILAQTLDVVGVGYSLHIHNNGGHGIATADSGSYPTYELPQCSLEIVEWEGRMISFFEEVGFHITDTCKVSAQ